MGMRASICCYTTTYMIYLPPPPARPTRPPRLRRPNLRPPHRQNLHSFPHPSPTPHPQTDRPSPLPPPAPPHPPSSLPPTPCLCPPLSRLATGTCSVPRHREAASCLAGGGGGFGASRGARAYLPGWACSQGPTPCRSRPEPCCGAACGGGCAGSSCRDLSPGRPYTAGCRAPPHAEPRSAAQWSLPRWGIPSESRPNLSYGSAASASTAGARILLFGPALFRQAACAQWQRSGRAGGREGKQAHMHARRHAQSF